MLALFKMVQLSMSATTQAGWQNIPSSIWNEKNNYIDLETFRSKSMCPDYGFPSSSDEESAVRYRERSRRSRKNTERRIKEVYLNNMNNVMGTENWPLSVMQTF